MGLSRVHFPITTLGPGKRLGIWFQGCHLRCVGCISIDTWPTAKKTSDIDVLLEQIAPWIKQAEGVTISGGEPFEQPEALIYLVRRLKQLTSVDILVYSGFDFADIATIVYASYPNIDVLISNPYNHRAPQTTVLRGSDNQQMHLLTELGNIRFKTLQNQLVTPQTPVLDIMFDQDGSVWFAGIPRQDDFLLLQTLLESDGHQVKTTAHAPVNNKQHHLNDDHKKITEERVTNVNDTVLPQLSN